MAIAAGTLVNQYPTTTFACMNDVIQQLWDIISADTNIVMISDNGGSDTVGRLLVFKHKEATHNMSFWAKAKVSILYTVKSIDGTKDLQLSSLSPNMAAIKFIYGPNSFCLTARKVLLFCIVSNTSAAGWVIGMPGGVVSTVPVPPGLWYPSNKDSPYTSVDVSAPAYNEKNADNSIPLIPAMFGTGPTQQTTISIWGVKNVFGIQTDTFYRDFSHVNYLYFYNSWLISDN